MPTLMYTDGHSALFWELSAIHGPRSSQLRVTLNYGEGRSITSSRRFDSSEACEQELEAFVAQKRALGYEELRGSRSWSGLVPPEAWERGEAELRLLEDLDADEAWSAYAQEIEGDEPDRSHGILDALAGGRERGPLCPFLERGSQPYLRANYRGEIQTYPAQFQAEWRHGFLAKAGIALEGLLSDPVHHLELLMALAGSPSARFLQELSLGKLVYQSWAGDRDFTELLEKLLAYAPRLPLRSLSLLGDSRCVEGDGGYCDNDGSSWTRSSIEIARLLDAFPRLSRLHAALSLCPIGRLQHPQLSHLSLGLGRFSEAHVQDLATAELPQLQGLRLSFCHRAGFVDGSASQLQGLLSKATFPRLRALALCDSQDLNAIASMVLHAPLLPSLQELALSDGGLDDAGAASLLEGRDALAHLEVLDLRNNGLSPEAIEALHQAFGSRVQTEGQSPQSDDDDDEF